MKYVIGIILSLFLTVREPEEDDYEKMYEMIG